MGRYTLALQFGNQVLGLLRCRSCPSPSHSHGSSLQRVLPDEDAGTVVRNSNDLSAELSHEHDTCQRRVVVVGERGGTPCRSHCAAPVPHLLRIRCGSEGHSTMLRSSRVVRATEPRV
jgi:hypothetical protein